MLKENKVLMQEAREALNGKWQHVVIAALVLMLVSGASSFIPFGSFIITGPLAMGSAYFFLMISRGNTPIIQDLFKGFNYFFNTLVAFLLVTLYTILWMLLLIVPGIIAALSYSQTFFILAEHPSMPVSEAIAKSKEMMNGNKWKYFCLGLRFIGWVILAMLTMGIGFLWLLPYMQVTFAKFHDDIKRGAETVKEPAVEDNVQAETSKEVKV